MIMENSLDGISGKSGRGMPGESTLSFATGRSAT
jgi:hypothetical protein